MALPFGPAGQATAGYVLNNEPIVLQLTATPASGSVATDTVRISPTPETITPGTARYRTRGEWRVTGTTDLKAGQTVAMVLGSDPETGQFIGQATIDAAGAFSFKGGLQPVAAGTTVTYVSSDGRHRHRSASDHALTHLAGPGTRRAPRSPFEPLERPADMNPVHHTRTGRAHAALSAGLLTLGLVAGTLAAPSPAQAEPAPVGAGFTVTPSDLAVHPQADQDRRAPRRDTPTPANPCGTLVGSARTRSRPAQPPTACVPSTARATTCSPAARRSASADQPFPRLTDAGVPRRRERRPPRSRSGPAGPTSYAQKTGSVFDSQPRVISNLIDDQTSTNPAAVAAAGFPVRAQRRAPLRARAPPTPTRRPPARRGCPGRCVPVPPDLADPERHYRRRPLAAVQLAVHVLRPVLRPRPRPDRQGRRHGLRPAAADDPLVTPAPTASPAPATRCAPQPGLHGADPGAEPARTGRRPGQRPTTCRTPRTPTRRGSTSPRPTLRTPRTRCSCASTPETRRPPVSTGTLLGGSAGATTGSPDDQPAWPPGPRSRSRPPTLLGIQLRDTRRHQRADDRDRPVRQLHPRPDRGLPQYVTSRRAGRGQRRPTAARCPVPADVLHFDTAVPERHRAQRGPVSVRTPTTTPRPRRSPPDADADRTASADFATQPPGTYDDEMLDSTSSVGTVAATRTSRSARSTRCSTPSTTGWSPTSRTS